MVQVLKVWFSRPLYLQIFVCLVIGVLIGLYVKPIVPIINPIGTVFLRLLRMLIVPLTFLSLVSGVLSMGDIKSLRDVGLRIISIFVLTTIFAASLGTAFGLIFNIGSEVIGLMQSPEGVGTASFSFVENIINWFPTNVLQSMGTDNMLQIIFFAVFSGCIMLLIGEQKLPTLYRVVNEGTGLMIRMTDLVMNLAPYGIMALVADMTASLGGNLLKEVAKFIAVEYTALAILLVVLYPLVLKFVGGLNPLRFFKGALPAMLVAASTTSSAATLPVSMRCAGENLGVPEKIYGFGLPLGATINMNGVAVYFGLVSVFASHLYNIPITPVSLFQFVFLGLILSMGAAGVKGGAIVMSTILLQTLGMPLTIMPVLAAINPIIDIGHTTLNVTGDIMTTTVVSARLNLLDRDVYDGKNAVVES
jgi:Na+/H+-dicarboxylate symporter